MHQLSSADPTTLGAWPALRVHECFEALVERQPSAPAVISDDGVLTYLELEQRANALAHALLALGLKREEAVGVLSERSGTLPVAFLGILKAGGAYVPMGIDLPAHRLANMAAQCGMRYLIALDGGVPSEPLQAALTSNAGERSTAVLRPEQLDENALRRDGHRPNRAGKATDLVAILFTSGSTGQPKGVLLQHDACVNMGYGHISAQGIAREDRLLLAAAPGFIMGFRELCLPLLSGGAFVPASRALLDDPSALLDVMARHRVTLAMFTPSYLRLLRGEVPAGLRCLLTAGERPNPDDARAYAQKLDYWNIQGATEVCGTICMLRVDPNASGPLPSGRPFANTAVYLLDEDGKPVSEGEVGEVYVVGVGVARGYLNQPGLTAERFVETPYGRAFRSNDLGRWDDQGQLESLGRVNDVVKVSGQSVSLGEIEQTLLRHRAVRSAAVIQHQGKLLAFVQGDRLGQMSLRDWHGFLAETLPGYMLPAEVTLLSKMPVNSSGKLDRQSLLELSKEVALSVEGAGRGAPPQGELERQIVAIWEETLGVSPIFREDDFFALGGTSLLSIVVSQRLQAIGYPVSAQSVLGATTVVALAQTMAVAKGQKPIETTALAAEGSATRGQQDFWIASNFGLGGSSSHITRVLLVQGSIPEPARWQSAWSCLILRHAALRTAFLAEGEGEVLFRTREAESLASSAGFSIDDTDSLLDADQCIAARSEKPFSLTEPPLARAGLVRVAEGSGETLFWFTLHHAVGDGLSAQIIQQEMHSLLLGRTLLAAPSGVAAASRAERHYLASLAAEHDRAYFRDALDALLTEAGSEAFGELLTDYRRPEGPGERSVTQIIERLDEGAVSALTGLAQKQAVGMHALLLALLQAEVRRRDGRSDWIIGTGVSTRPPGTDSAVGHFVNVLPLVLRSGAKSLAEQMRDAQRALTEAVAHGSYPSSLIYREFRQRHPHVRPYSRTSLFDISLTVNPSRYCGDAARDFSLTPRSMPGGRAYRALDIDLAFSHEPIEEDGGGLELSLVWNPLVYSAKTAQAWLSSLAAWARWLAEDVSRAGGSLPALLPAELESLQQWERGPSVPRPAKRYHELFESVAERYPQRPAVVTELGVQSYAELERRANCVAHALLDLGVTREESIAVLTEPSAELPATVLGIWKAGAVYVPLAPEYPGTRLSQMATAAGAKKLIVLDGHAVPVALAEAVESVLRPEAWSSRAPSERPQIPGEPGDLAYIVFTSGTTGHPKGVLIQHDSLINSALMSGEVFGLTPEDRFSLAATTGFDASLWELGVALVHGMALVPVPRALRDDPWELKRCYRKLGVTVAFHAPSYLRISKETPFEGLRVLVTGGEAPNHDDARHHANYVGFWNAYGPTEACMFVCAEQLSSAPDLERPLSAGRPLGNVRISIRRDNGDQVPPGSLGEVWLGGLGLARGYMNDPELTGRRFVETADGRWYRSGDLGRFSDDGRLVLAGRADHQVKLHGQRLELGEIEQCLLSHPAVLQAAVVMGPSVRETQILWAFVCLRASAAAPSEEDLRAYLGEHLAGYMIPAAIIAVAAIPVTPHGKIDRDALLLSVSRRSAGVGKSAPSSEMESRVAALWMELLGETVSREDNFFALGGNSLLAVVMAHRLSLELERPVAARELFAAPTLAAFARRTNELLDADSAADNVPALALESSDRATEGQREFWVAEAAGLDTRTFTIPVMRLVEGPMPTLERWVTAWAALVARHAALRTYFREDPLGRLLRVEVPNLAESLETSIQPDAGAARAFARQRQGEPFIMSKPPLWRAGLVEVEESDEHLFWLALHHSLGDGQSIGILMEELSALLRGEPLSPLTSDFSESASREQIYLASPACASDARYWADLLARQPDSAFDDGPLDFPRSATAKTGNHRFETRLDAPTAQGLKTLARWHEASIHAVMLTLLALEARRRQGRSVTLIGTAASVRETASDARVVGYYINMLPVACQLPREVTFGGALRETQRALSASLQHERYPFSRIYRDFWSERPQQRHPARYPLFDLAVTENPESHPAVASLRLTRSPVANDARPGSVAYEFTDASPGPDMVLTHQALADGGLLLQWHVNAAFYSRETAASWLTALTDWSAWLAEDRHRARSALPALLPREAELLSAWEQGAKKPRPSLPFDQLFEQILDATPHLRERPAVITRSGITTYESLERDANVVAHALLQRGIVAGKVVGVLAERSAKLPAAVLGIWKARGIYLPLAADLPPERLLFMARDAGMALLMVLDGLAVPTALTQDRSRLVRPEELGEAFFRAHIHRPLASGEAAESAAYVIYTSGSTGRPKGTLISHGAYINSLLGVGETIGLTESDRTLMFASLSFDVSLSDIGMPLLFGAALCPVPLSILESPNRFRALLAELDVTVADLTPTYLRLLEGAPLPSLRVLVTGGEPPFAEDVANYARHQQYFDAYGPTENTITSSMRRLSPVDDGVVAGGRPLPNTSIQVCDAEGTPLPPGVTGELWLGGAGLALSYLGQPDLTLSAFVETAQGRRYRSGDLGRWRAPGEIEILGRRDDQVKINGIRIELGEIEHAIDNHPDIAQAVALVDGDAERGQSLWAFVRPVSGKQAPSEASWRDYLADRLPVYMIPSAVIAVSEIPRSNAGKVDKAALRALRPERVPRGEVLPQDGLEAEVARCWSELLGGASGAIHSDDNFFALGGHSLLAIAVAHRLEKALGYPVPARELFAEPTLHGFARRIRQLADVVVPRVAPSNRATEGQREFWVAEQAGLDTRAFNMSLTLQVAGEVPGEGRWRSAWATLVSRHAALRTGFQHEQGELRRFQQSGLEEAWESTAQPSVDAAIAQIRARQAEPFAMHRPPLWRAGLVEVTGSGQSIFWLTVHHSIGDGVSLRVLVEELSSLLHGAGLPPLDCHFDDWAGSEENYLAGPAGEEDALYWRKVLGTLAEISAEGVHPFDEWPLDFPRPLARTVSSSKGAHVFRVSLDPPAAAGLHELAQRNGASLHALILAITAHEVRRRIGRSEFVLGTVASTRDSASEATLVGYCVNTLPVPCRGGRGDSIEQGLRAMQENLLEGLKHARYPFARIHQEFRRTHAFAPHPARHPLFDLAVAANPPALEGTSQPEAAFHFEDVGPAIHDADGASLHYEHRPAAPAQDMVLTHDPQPDGRLALTWHVNAAIYEEETARAWIESLVLWMRFLGRSERIAGAPLPLLLPEEEATLAVWERGAVVPPPAPSLPARFEYWAQIQPDRPAVIVEGGAQSYALINSRANALARALESEGVTRGTPVGVLTSRSVALVETVLAIWKAGGCYLPLLADTPSDRLQFMARDAGIRVLVVLDGHQLPAWLAGSDCRILRPETLSAEFYASHGQTPPLQSPSIHGFDHAYVIYTSGSTGLPKGVVLRHEGLNNLGVGTAAALDVRSDDRALLMASPAFDAWLAELATAFTAGAALVPVSGEELGDIAGMRDKLARLGVSLAIMTPSYLRLFEQAEFPSLRVLMTVGESPHRADALHYAARLRYINGYGPTENTAAASYGQILPEARRLTAGKPMINCSIHILNREGEPVPPNAIGMVWLGGIGLATGYLNQPKLTAASFVDTPSGRRYCTGDLGRWTETGDLRILGRADGQVKLRGQRVELGEIEHRLTAHPSVREGVAAVETRPDGTQRLWAFVSLHSGATEPTQAEWHDHLSSTLPSYMLPSAVVRVTAIPFSTAGKVDRTALLRGLSEQRADAAGALGYDLRSAEPCSDKEWQIARVWAACLECPSIGREDNFFDLGGNSLQVISVVNQLRRTFQATINDLYDHPRLADFARVCRPQPDHLQTVLSAAARHWEEYRDALGDYEAERDAALSAARQVYEKRNRSYGPSSVAKRCDNSRVLLTGATGYLGTYLLRELLADPDRHVSVLVRGGDEPTARSRLQDRLGHYFGAEKSASLCNDPRLTVVAGDLRRDDLGLPSRTRDWLASQVQAIFHCAANVKHFGHGWEFHADNVAATGRLLRLASHRSADPADFHLVSTISSAGSGPETGFQLFTEYDPVPELLDDNYYIRSKQEAERLVVAARSRLANACIHRVGNLVFAADGGPLATNIEDNAFFRQLAAFLRLGVVPDDSHVWLSHVDIVARGLVLLADAAELTNETHHLENSRRDTLAAFVSPADTVRASGFDSLLQRLLAALDEPEMQWALSETLENLRLYSGTSPQRRARRLEIASDRTQSLLAALGVVWPSMPAAGQSEMLRSAGKFSSRRQEPRGNPR